MIKEFFVFSINLTIVALVTSLVLAYPAAMLSRKLFRRPTKFFKAYLVILAVDVLGHIAVMLFSFPFGRYRPPVLMDAVYLAENLFYLVAVGIIISWRFLDGGRPMAKFIGPGLGWSLATGLMIIVKDILMFVAISAWIYPEF